MFANFCCLYAEFCAEVDVQNKTTVVNNNGSVTINTVSCAFVLFFRLKQNCVQYILIYKSVNILIN